MRSYCTHFMVAKVPNVDNTKCQKGGDDHGQSHSLLLERQNAVAALGDTLPAFEIS